MSKHAELIERLRRQSLELTVTGKASDYSIGDLAADALEAQEREIAELQTELARALTSARLIREGLKTMREVES